VGGLRDRVRALEELQVGLGVVALDGAEEELEGLTVGGLPRAEAREEASPAFGPNLLAALQVDTSSGASVTVLPQVPSSSRRGAQ